MPEDIDRGTFDIPDIFFLFSTYLEGHTAVTAFAT